MPKLWTDTIEEHRRAVRDATLDTAAALAAKHGLASVTMSQIAEETGIGRATLYKYFPDVEAVLFAWHERQLARHLRQLGEVAERAQPGTRLEKVLESYAALSRQGHGSPQLAEVLHRGDHIAHAERQLERFLSNLIAEAAADGTVRADVSPDELASYCLHALVAARTASSKAAVRRLVGVTLSGLRPDPRGEPDETKRLDSGKLSRKTGDDSPLRGKTHANRRRHRQDQSPEQVPGPAMPSHEPRSGSSGHAPETAQAPRAHPRGRGARRTDRGGVDD